MCSLESVSRADGSAYVCSPRQPNSQHFCFVDGSALCDCWCSCSLADFAICGRGASFGSVISQYGAKASQKVCLLVMPLTEFTSCAAIMKLVLSEKYSLTFCYATCIAVPRPLLLCQQRHRSRGWLHALWTPQHCQRPMPQQRIHHRQLDAGYHHPKLSPKHQYLLPKC